MRIAPHVERDKKGQRENQNKNQGGKNMKRLTALGLAAMMALGLGAVSVQAEEEKYPAGYELKVAMKDFDDVDYLRLGSEDHQDRLGRHDPGRGFR